MMKRLFLIVIIISVLIFGTILYLGLQIKNERTGNIQELNIQPVKPFSILSILKSIPIINKINKQSTNSEQFEIKGSSMHPNYKSSEYYAVDRSYYNINTPQRGDVIILKNPKSSNIELARRVVGLPGEKIEIKDGKVLINDVSLSETYLSPDTITNITIGDFILEGQKLTLPTEQYFLLGDNRNHSVDSRQWGFISKNLVLGKVLSCISNCGGDTVGKKEDDESDYVPGEVLVTFKENTIYKQAKDLFSSLGISVYENAYWKATNKKVDDTTTLFTVDVFKIKVTSGIENEIVNKLMKESIVRAASKNYIGRITK